jgi:RNA polymerase sigma-70 factor (ECF subfamily)
VRDIDARRIPSMASVPSPGLWMEAGREAGLVLSATQGSFESYWELMEHYQRPLYRLAFALTRDRDDAAQVTHETLIQGWRQLKQFQVGHPFLPWLLRTLRGLSVAARRRRAGEPLPATAGPGGARARVFRAAFAELSVNEQLVLALGAVEHLPHHAMGVMLEVPAHTALSQLSAARERLRARVAAHSKGDG